MKATDCLDSYKLGHAEQYPEGTTKVYSNFTARNNALFKVPDEYKDNKIVWVGLQVFLYDMNDLWNETFFDVPWKQVERYLDIYAPFVGPNGFDKSRLKALHELGYLPLHIKSLPEGSVVPVGVPLLTITNTHPDFYWLPNFLETWLSSELWKASTSATTARIYRKILNKYNQLTSDNPDLVDWQCHDFSVRGMSGIADAAKSGIGHLVYFSGTDNIPAVRKVQEQYGSLVYGSVPATEHSVMCAGGKESELQTFERLLNIYPSGIVSIVSDTWDFWKVLTEYTVLLKDKILARTPDAFGNCKVVFRPDSGNPVDIIAGIPYYDVDINEGGLSDAEIATKYGAIKSKGKYYEIETAFEPYEGWVAGFDVVAELPEHAVKGAVEVLADIFGYTTNSKGYKVVNSKVGLIYGDSITTYRADEILSLLQEKGFSSDNIVFGIGSYTYQYQTRDTLGFAMKATYVEIDGEGFAISKEPKTDKGTKKSAKGLLRVIKENGEFKLLQKQVMRGESEGELKTVFIEGKVLVERSFNEIQQLAKENL